MEQVYREFRNYDFESSPSYKKTLDQVYNQYLIVLSDKDLEVKQDIGNGVFNPERIPQADREQLQLQTQIYVFCLETDNILELQDYQYWLATSANSQAQQPAAETDSNAGATAGVARDVHAADEAAASDAAVAVDSNPPQEEYSSNYQEIVDMIVNNKEIPGVRQIPKTILDPADASASVLQQRKKPWEKEEDPAPSPNVEA